MWSLSHVLFSSAATYGLSFQQFYGEFEVVVQLQYEKVVILPDEPTNVMAVSTKILFSIDCT